MNVRFLNSYNYWKNTAAFCLILILACAFCVSQRCQGETSSTGVTVADDPFKQVNWASGPQHVSLGDFADVDIPAGYRLTDISGARILLQSGNQAVPSDLIGILAS